MAKRRGGPVAVCPVPAHAGSHVVSRGRRAAQSGVRQVFHCTPVGYRQHRFSVVVAGAAETPVPVWSPPPSCPEHPAGNVVRDGRYGRSTAKKRQRYRCYPDPDDRAVYHRFTPWLPREHVHLGEDACEVCEELRGTHRGGPAVSRRQSWSDRIVADALRDLARGETYAAVSMRAREATGRTRTRTPAGRAKAKGGKADSRNSWHIAADWCETFAPVLWEHVEGRLRDRVGRAVAERDRLAASGEVNPKPVVIAIDEFPVWTRQVDENSKRSARRDYSVLSVAELGWRERHGELERTQSLRLLRAYPSGDHLAWKLVFEELGYVPDFIISDSDDSQTKAIDEFYRSAPLRPVVIPSMFHVRRNVTEALEESPGAFVQLVAGGIRQLRPEIGDHVACLSREQMTAMTPAGWSAWWDTLEALLVSFGAPLEPVALRRQRHEPAVAGVLPILAAYPQLPLSTGGIEFAIRSKVEPIFANRGHAFANLERTNRLLDLVVCDEHGLFNRMPKVVELLRTDTGANHGWSTPLRAVTDPQPPSATRFKGRYSSLRDQLLLRDVARTKGIA